MSSLEKRSPLEKRTQRAFISFHVLTVCCQSILTTQIISPNPKPQWFDDLNEELSRIKTLAASWNNNIAPSVTSSILLKVLNYAPVYKPVNDEINDISRQFPNAKGADDPHIWKVQQLIKIFTGEIDSIVGDIDQTCSKVHQWGIDIKKAYDDLSSGVSLIQKAEAELAADIEAMNSAIDKLHKMIDSENNAIADVEITIGVSIITFIIGIGLVPLTSGASLITSGAGALTAAGSEVSWSVLQEKINKQFKQVTKDQAGISVENRQLVALQSLALPPNLVISSLNSASGALSDFRNLWVTFKEEMEDALNKLDSAEQSLSTITEQFFSSAAAEEWATAEKFIQGLNSLKVQREEKTLPMDSKAA